MKKIWLYVALLFCLGSAAQAELNTLVVSCGQTGQPACQLLIPGRMMYPISLVTVTTDTANGFNSANHTYVIPQTGLYTIISKVRVIDALPRVNIGLGIGVNGTFADSKDFVWGSVAGIRHTSMNIEMYSFNAGDIIQPFVYCDSYGMCPLASAALTIQQQCTVTLCAGSGVSGVSSLNTLTGAVNIVGGTNVTVTPSGNTLTIASTGGSGMVYPSAGIAVSSGTAWLSSLAVPSSNIVGISDTQTLTNKSIAASEINSGTLSAAQLPVATTSTLGAVKIDGTSITISNGVISSTGGGGGVANCTSSTTFHCTIPIVSDGIIDGLYTVNSTTATSNTISTTSKSGLFMNKVTGGTAATTYVLPAAVAGLGYCISNYTAVTSSLVIQTSGAGQYIDVQGIASASGGKVSSAGALGDYGCVQAVDSTTWKFSQSSGTWTVQ